MRGFTLVEFLISMVILSVVFAGIYMVLSVAQVSWDSGEGMLDLQQSLRPALDGMTRELRRSSSAGVVISGINAERIDFSVPGSSNTIGYYISGTQLIREHPAAAIQVLANDVNQLSFCCVGGADCFDCANSPMVQIQLGAAKTIKGRSLQQFDIIDEVKLRNE